MQPERELDELLPVPPGADGAHIDGHGGGPYMPSTSIDVFAKVRGHERAEQLRAAREADLLPYFRTLEGPALPVVEMEGAERIMLGSNNYLGLTDDPRVVQGARDALEPYGTGLTGSRLLNGTIALHLELERELAEWMGTEDAIVFTTGHQANVGTLGTILVPGDTVIADSGDHASILDGCLLSRAKLRPFRHNRLDKLEKALDRAAGDGGGVLVVVDGVFSMEGDVAPLVEIAELCAAHGARLMVDEAHGAGVLGARGAGASELLGVEDRVDLRMGTFSKIARLVRRLRRRPGRGHRVPAHPVAGLPLHRLGRAGRDRRRAGGAARRALGRRAPAAGRRARRTRATCATGSRSAASRSCSRHRLPDGSRRRHADRPRAGGRRLEGGAAVAGALRRRRVRQHRRCTPPSRRAARCCARASWRPTTARRSTARSTPSATVKAAFEAEHGPLPQRPLP